MPCPAPLTLADAADQPWPDGGVARHLIDVPAGADWRLRLSLATLDQDGPLARWDGVRRWLAVVDGDGVSLTAPGWARLALADAPPVRFDGHLAPDCRRLGGPVRLLHLTLRDGATGTLLRADPGPWAPGSASTGLFTMQAGRCDVDGDGVDMPGGGALLWFDTAPTTMAFTPSAPGPRRAWWIVGRPTPLDPRP